MYKYELYMHIIMYMYMYMHHVHACIHVYTLPGRYKVHVYKADTRYMCTRQTRLSPCINPNLTMYKHVFASVYKCVCLECNIHEPYILYM